MDDERQAAKTPSPPSTSSPRALRRSPTDTTAPIMAASITPRSTGGTPRLVTPREIDELKKKQDLEQWRIQEMRRTVEELKERVAQVQEEAERLDSSNDRTTLKMSKVEEVMQNQIDELVQELAITKKLQRQNAEALISLKTRLVEQQEDLQDQTAQIDNLAKDLVKELYEQVQQRKQMDAIVNELRADSQARQQHSLSVVVTPRGTKISKHTPPTVPKLKLPSNSPRSKNAFLCCDCPPRWFPSWFGGADDAWMSREYSPYSSTVSTSPKHGKGVGKPWPGQKVQEKKG
mmetsp:Transcript_125454/g.217529  ORF Transcript_125454/g.217529 Transcript_125454/m.217529 type:complete len:290 (-) Transcript_125454:1536-2405(-)